jgi:hypothetical protein
MRRPSRAPRPRGVGLGPAAILVALAATVVVSFAGPTAGAAAAAPAAGDRVTFGVTPSSASGPDGRSELTYDVSPGEVLYDHVAALNYSSQPLILQLYASDAVETTEGSFGLALAGAHQTGVGSWISIPAQDATITVPPRVTLGPGKVVVPITLRVPATAAPGDVAGGILVSLATTGRNRSGQEITLDQRTGTRVLVTVSGAVAPQLAVTDVRASYSGSANPVARGTVHISYTVHNTGNVDLSVALKGSVSGLVGTSVHTRLPEISFLLPGDSVSESSTVRGVWPQVVSRASVTATAETIANGRSVGLTPVTASTTVWTVPWVLLLIVVALIVGLLLYPRRRKSRAQGSDRGSGAPLVSSPAQKVEVPV